jgi:hypothetical protein
MSMSQVVHCWKGKSDHAEEVHGHGSPEWIEAFLEDGTCMLLEGHEGEHEFTPDREIGVAFGGHGNADPYEGEHG